MLVYKNLGMFGRLGNQLWELASTAGIAFAEHQAPGFPLEWKYRPFFCVPDEFFHNGIANVRSVLDCHARLDHLDARARPYLQDIGLWREYEEVIRGWLRPSYEATSILHERFPWYYELPRPITAVHVRRGDNVNEGEWKANYHPAPTLSYFNSALELLGETEGTVVAFSDDPDWCAGNLTNVKVFRGGYPMPKEHEPEYWRTVPTDWIDFFALCGADRFVLSNSTFGWWAAYLSESQDVIYPANWYGPALDYIDTSLMFTDLGWTPHAA